MALAGIVGAISHLFPDQLKQLLDPVGVFSDLFKEAEFHGAHAGPVDRSAVAEGEQYEAGFPAWIQLVLVLAAVIPILYLIVSNKKPKVFLNAQEWQELKLTEKEVVSHNVRRFRFALPEKNMILGLPIGSHISISAQDTAGKAVMRPYTPVTDDNLKGAVEFVIKLYPEGKMSQCLDRLSVGDALQFKGPRGRFNYQPNMKRALGMVAGGSGITPMFQVCQAILRNPYDATKIFLVYANRAEEDILLREKLDAWAKKERSRFKVFYVLEKPPADWQGGKGYVSQDIVHEHLPLPNPEVMVLRCGPPAMNKAVETLLDDAGFSKDMQFEF